jgi:hypothetical protein
MTTDNETGQAQSTASGRRCVHLRPSQMGYPFRWQRVRRTRLTALDWLELPHDLSAEATWQFADQIDGERDIALPVLRQAAARHRVSVFAMLVTAVVAALARMRRAASRHVPFSLDGHGSAQARDVALLSTAAFICVPGAERDSLVHVSLAFNPTLFSTTQAHSIIGEVTNILTALEDDERTLA